MKRIAIIVVMALMTFTASATSIRYFTYSQASRTVQYLNAQSELMIYCGYDYEIETYVLINEVWMERVNSAYYELWVYGYDAYTGDEIYMPLDLQCVWLYSAGRMYNAAQYLRFHATVHMPSFAWYIPPYYPYTRRAHAIGYMRSYHYDIHRHGWMPPTPPFHGYGPHTQAPLPPYYMRTPQTPPPAPVAQWTPGLEHPQVNNSGSHGGTRSDGAVPTTRPSSSGTATPGTAPRSGSVRGTDNDNTSATRATETRGTESRGTEARGAETRSGSATTTRGTGTTPTRSNTGTTRSSESGTTQESGTATRTGSTTRSSGTATSTSTSRSGSSSGRSTGTTTRSDNTTNTRSSGTTTNTRSTSTNGSRTTSTRSTEKATR